MTLTEVQPRGRPHRHHQRGDITTITKAGTNDGHGSPFFNSDSDSLNASPKPVLCVGSAFRKSDLEVA